MWRKIWNITKAILFFVPSIILGFFALRSSSNRGRVSGSDNVDRGIRDGIADSESGTRESIEAIKSSSDDVRESTECIGKSIKHTSTGIDSLQRARDILERAKERTRT